MEPTNLSEIIRLTSNISVAFPLVAYLSRIRYANKRIHIIGTLVAVSGISDLVGFVLSRNHQSTIILFNVYYVVIFSLLTWFYYEILFANTRRVVIWIGIAIYLQSLILVTGFVQSFLEYQTLMWVITAIIMIVYSIAYFFYSFSTIPAANLVEHTFSWINIGVLIYFCMSLFLFLLGNFALTKLDPELGRLIWSFHNVNNILKNILFCVGFYFYKKRVVDFA